MSTLLTLVKEKINMHPIIEDRLELPQYFGEVFNCCPHKQPSQTGKLLGKRPSDKILIYNTSVLKQTNHRIR